MTCTSKGDHLGDIHCRLETLSEKGVALPVEDFWEVPVVEFWEVLATEKSQFQMPSTTRLGGKGTLMMCGDVRE